MRVIFLDCDGVLNSHKYFNTSKHDDSIDGLNFGETQLDPSALDILDKVVEQTDAYIVISSSWRHIWDFNEIAQMFKNRGFKNFKRVIGQTPNSPDDNRGDEVKEWLETDPERRVVDPDMEPVTSYVILDDTTQFNSDQMPRFVRTDPRVGLTPANAQKAIGILSRDI